MLAPAARLGRGDLADQRSLVVSAVLASMLVLLAALAGHEELLAFAAPVLVLVLPLLAGRYVGEDRIARVAGTPRRRPPRRRPAVPAPRRRGSVRLGLRAAWWSPDRASLAVRPPPLSALV